MLIVYSSALHAEAFFGLEPSLADRVMAAAADVRHYFVGLVLARVRRAAEQAADRTRHARNPYRPNTRCYVMWETAYHARLLHIELLPRAIADDWRS